LAYADRVEQPRRLSAASRRGAALLETHAEPAIAGAVALAFIAISVWWVQTDARIPSGDNGKHIVHAFGYLDQFSAGHWLSPILLWTEYPPLVHVVGAVAAALGGASVPSVVIAENLVFVPLLVLGCYKAGEIAFGRLAGLSAVLFALASPMVISLFHVFMLDAPAAALAAVSAWLLLASRRFASLPWSLAAAGAIAAGMYVKATFVFFVVGLVLLLLARGGWRNWRNFAIALGGFLILVEPWYFAHLEQLRGMATGALQPQAVFWYGGVPYPDRWSVGNFTWYAWSLVNNQLYVPLLALAVVGTFVSALAWLRDRASESYVPELIAGGLVAYVGVSMISIDDPRYLVPATVYFAVLGTGWITRLPGRWRTAAVAALALVLLVNTTFQNLIYTPEPRRLALSLPGAPENSISQRSFTFFSNRGYGEGQPDSDGVAPHFIGLLSRAREDGAKQVVFQPESMNSGGYNLFGLTIFARSAGLHVPGFVWNALGPEDIYVFRVHPSQVGQPPCLESWDGTGIYMQKGHPTPGNPIYCPPA
jgi:hypothetical protein